ncbi:AAA family ATPase, partial [Enterobacter hormaechei]|uniref:AAA family ATPase n=1 Tax=Enterobacter hormaechei TaxID=158836 RepID=UPI00123A5AD5
GWNPFKEALFIVDDASMVSNNGGNRLFGTGCLLDDLIQFVYTGAGCRLMMVGDTAQLPPVGEEESPALQPSTVEGYGLNVRMAELTEVVRQAQTSAVLRNATHLRLQISTFDGTSVQGAYADDGDAYHAVNENGL